MTTTTVGQQNSGKNAVHPLHCPLNYSISLCQAKQLPALQLALVDVSQSYSIPSVAYSDQQVQTCQPMMLAGFYMTMSNVQHWLISPQTDE